MISRKSSHSTSSSTSSSTSRNSSVHPPSALTDDWDADEEDNMSSQEPSPPRRLSVAIPGVTTAQGPYCPRRPSLREILANTSPAPWSLAAFMAYLSNNHCLETLEFTMDAGRYRKHYQKMMSRAGSSGLPSSKDRDYVRALWQRLVDAYIRPNGSREVNLPSDVRDPILNVAMEELPPHPENLDRAVIKIYELMEESVLVPFLNSAYHKIVPHSASSCPCEITDDGSALAKSPTVRSRPIGSSSPSGAVEARSPSYAHHRQSAPSTLTTAMNRSRFSVKLSPTTSAPVSGPSGGASDAQGASSEAVPSYSGSTLMGKTDDSTSAIVDSPTSEMLMTPPTSPPMSDVSSKRDSGMWRKIGRLGKKRRSQGGLRDDHT